MGQVPWNKGHRKFGARRKQVFIATLRDTASAMKAAEAAGVCIDTAYAARREDMEFRVQWEQAVDVALDQLMGEAFRRSMRGVEEPVVQGGQWIEYEDDDGERKRLTITKYSDRLLEVLLKFRYGDQLADRVKVTAEGPLGLEPQVLMRMEPVDRRLLLGLLQKYAALARPEPVELSPIRAALGHGAASCREARRPEPSHEAARDWVHGRADDGRMVRYRNRASAQVRINGLPISDGPRQTNLGRSVMPLVTIKGVQMQCASAMLAVMSY